MTTIEDVERAKREPITELECDHCGSVVVEADADGMFWDGTKADCKGCGEEWIVTADESCAYLVPHGAES